MFPLPAILILGNSKVYVSIMNGGNMASYIKAVVNESLNRCTTLEISYVNLYNGYVRLWRDFNNS